MFSKSPLFPVKKHLLDYVISLIVSGQTQVPSYPQCLAQDFYILNYLFAEPVIKWTPSCTILSLLCLFKFWHSEKNWFVFILQSSRIWHHRYMSLLLMYTFNFVFKLNYVLNNSIVLWLIIKFQKGTYLSPALKPPSSFPKRYQYYQLLYSCRDICFAFSSKLFVYVYLYVCKHKPFPIDGILYTVVLLNFFHLIIVISWGTFVH